MVIADNLSHYVSLVYGDVGSMSGPNLVAATVLFAVQLYMDFSGCCDIALGAARILGYDLIENFQSPFEARTFNDFWRRWHISMTSWFRDYVYFSLGGSRCAPWRHYLNIVIVFVCSGLWHGADWRYLAWGLFTGLVNGCLQMLLGFWAPPTPTFIYFLGEVLLDYLVAFMALGMAELFARPFKNRMVGVAVGTAVAGFLRFMCSFLSGVLVWGNLSDGLSAWTYSLVYNASYMLPETLITVVGAVLLIRVAPQIFDRQYAKA